MNQLSWTVVNFLHVFYRKYIHFRNIFILLKQKNRPRVFCIGYMKTGTTSLYKALNILGYRTIRIPYSDAYRKKGLEKYLNGLKKCNFDAFIDFPMGENELYSSLDRAFPESKFILTIRDPSSFIKSYVNFYKHSPWKMKVTDPNEIEQLKYEYTKRNSQILEYFKKKPSHLLTMNIIDGEGWDELCRFLKKPIPRKPFPHKNKGKYYRN